MKDRLLVIFVLALGLVAIPVTVGAHSWAEGSRGVDPVLTVMVRYERGRPPAMVNATKSGSSIIAYDFKWPHSFIKSGHRRSVSVGPFDAIDAYVPADMTVLTFLVPRLHTIRVSWFLVCEHGVRKMSDLAENCGLEGRMGAFYFQTELGSYTRASMRAFLDALKKQLPRT